MEKELKTYKRQIAAKGLFQRLPDTVIGLQKAFRAVLDRALLDLIEPRVSGIIKKEAEDFWRNDNYIAYVCEYADLDITFVKESVKTVLILYGLEVPWEK